MIQTERLNLNCRYPRATVAANFFSIFDVVLFFVTLFIWLWSRHKSSCHITNYKPRQWEQLNCCSEIFSRFIWEIFSQLRECVAGVVSVVMLIWEPWEIWDWWGHCWHYWGGDKTWDMRKRPVITCEAVLMRSVVWMKIFPLHDVSIIIFIFEVSTIIIIHTVNFWDT